MNVLAQADSNLQSSYDALLGVFRNVQEFIKTNGQVIYGEWSPQEYLKLMRKWKGNPIVVTILKDHQAIFGSSSATSVIAKLISNVIRRLEHYQMVRNVTSSTPKFLSLFSRKLLGYMFPQLYLRNLIYAVQLAIFINTLRSFSSTNAKSTISRNNTESLSTSVNDFDEPSPESSSKQSLQLLSEDMKPSITSTIVSETATSIVSLHSLFRKLSPTIVTSSVAGIINAYENLGSSIRKLNNEYWPLVSKSVANNAISRLPIQQLQQIVKDEQALPNMQPPMSQSLPSKL